MAKVEISFTINNEDKKVKVEESRTLLYLIREELGLMGTKKGCETGDCGACTVIMNGKTVHSCMVLAVQADGCNITTIEGLGDIDNPHPIQRAFIEAGAIQCGYCTPGMIMSTKYLLDNNPDPSEEEIRRALSGNLCRCTGYSKIVEAVKIAARKMKGGLQNNEKKG